jgi:hypothetical protein
MEWWFQLSLSAVECRKHTLKSSQNIVFPQGFVKNRVVHYYIVARTCSVQTHNLLFRAAKSRLLIRQKSQDGSQL